MSMRSKTTFAGLTILLVAAACQDAPSPAEIPLDGPAFARGGNKGGNNPGPTENMVDLGRMIFQDEALSANGNQSCETCHHPAMGFAGSVDPDLDVVGGVIEGSLGAFGDRKPPTAAYATLTPVFQFSGRNAVGGSFWDGRATGHLLGSPAVEQALGPFLNPKEQALANEACVLEIIAGSAYRGAFETIFRVDLGSLGLADACASTEDVGDAIEAQYHNVGRAVAAYEASLNRFDSDFDRGQMSPAATRGAKLFGSSGKCQQCHDDKGGQPLFTDFMYHNLGVPRNPDNPMYIGDPNWVDLGLGGRDDVPDSYNGRFKTPTARNVAIGESGRTYMHNGSLVTLWHVVQFYNTRDVLPVCSEAVSDGDPMAWGPAVQGHPAGAGAADCWPAPEYPENMDSKNMGNLGLSPQDVSDIVAFMRALSDHALLGG